MNYISVGRTSYFRVKDEAAFLKWASMVNLETAKRGDETGGTTAVYYCLLADEGFSSYISDDAGDDEDISIAQEISNHLAPGEIVVIQEIGHEGLRYLSGWATAVNAVGETCSVSIDDIYQKAADFFGKKCQDIPQAQY